MSDLDLHEAIFDWFHPEAQIVVITGAFDNWSGSTHLGKIENGFEAKVKVPWGEKTLYKYIVDGKWTNDPTKPTEVDHEGNVNNVYQAPPKPSIEAGSTVDKVKETVQQVHTDYVVPAAAAVTAAVAKATSTNNDTATEAVSPTAAPLVSAAESMPPTTLQVVLDQTKAAVAAVASQANGAVQARTTLTTSKETSVELHPSETPAAPLLDAAASMPPTAAQQALDTAIVAKDKVVEIHETHVAPAVAAIQNSIPEGTSQKVTDTAVAAQQAAGTAAQKVHETIVAPAVAAAVNAIPEEHKQKINDAIAPVVEKANAATPVIRSTIGADSLGTTGSMSAFAYVASGLGAAIKTVTGVDPINVDKIPIPTPATEGFPSPPLDSATPLSAPPTAPAVDSDKPLPLTEPLAPVVDAIPATPATPALASAVEPLAVAQADSPKIAEPAPVPPASTHTPVTPVVAPPVVAPPPVEKTDSPSEKATTPAAPPPVTPPKASFPSTETESITSSAPSTPSKYDSTRKKRTSIFGKLKNVFHHEKEKK